MRLVALDTTTRAGSLAVLRDEVLLAQHAVDQASSYAEQLPGAILRLLDSVGLGIADVDVFAVAVGPGSFTGLRIGIATIQGLAFVTRRSVVGVSALDAMGHAGSDGVHAGAMVGVWMDARRRDVFSALYRVADGPPFTAARLTEVEPPSIGAPIATLERWTAEFGRPARIVGDGATMYERVIGPPTSVRAAPALAETIGRIAAVRARAGESIDPSAVQPLYIRRSDAEIARELAGRHVPPSLLS
jgi:tRNA threonylcarbamoyladenosine biosynthesis protein TsaB